MDLYGGQLKGQLHGLTSLFLLGRPQPDGLSTVAYATVLLTEGMC